MEYKVGDVVFVAHTEQRDQSRNREEIVTKVGRKWIYIGEQTRFDPDTGAVDAGHYPTHAFVWKSREDYERHQHLNNRWSKIRQRISVTYTKPKDIEENDLSILERMFGLQEQNGTET